jgi:predicted RecA/RadA family phage recombinase
MKTFKQYGDVVTLTAPSGGVVSGTTYLIGSLVVIATETVAQTLPFDAFVVGAANVVKVADEAWTEGLKIYWDDSAKKFTKTVASNPLAGVAVQPLVPAVVTLVTNAGAPMTIAGMVISVVTYGSLSGKTVTVTINGVPTVLTEGAGWTAATSNNATATSLASAIDALTGVTAAAVSADVTVVPATGIAATTLATGYVRLDGAAR